MKAILSFLFGLGIGVGVFYFAKDYLKENNLFVTPKKAVLSSQTVVNATETPNALPTASPYDYFTETPTLTPTISLTPTPTVKIKYSPTPTKKPSVTPTKIISSTPSPSITPTATQILSNITATVSIVPTPIKAIVQAATSQEINGFIDRFAGQYGVDPNVLRYIAICESGFNPLALSGNGLYAGLYQFSFGTWNTYRLKIGEDANPDLRFNGEEAVQTASYIMSIGKSSIWPNCLPK